MRFKCNVEDLNKAIQSVKKIMDIAKQQPYILFKANGGVIDVCYSDGNHAYIEKVVAEVESDGEFILDFENLSKIISSAMPTQTLSVNPLEVEMGENNVITIKVEKCISDGELGGKIASSMTHQLQAENVEKNPNKYGMITRMEYEDMFNSDAWDVWTKQELKDTIQLAVPNDKDDRDSTIYFSSKDKEVKVRANLYVGIIKADTIDGVAFAFKVNEANAFSDIISKFGGSDVYVTASSDNKFAKIKNSEDTAALWFAISPSQRIDGKVFQMYDLAEINDIQIRVHKGAFEGVISSIISTTKDKEHNLKIINTEDGYALSLAVSASGGSIKMDMKTNIEGIRYKDGVTPEEYSANLDIKTLKDIIDKCNYEWLSISLSNSDKVMRITDIEVEEVDGGLVPKEVARFYMTLS